jgi:diguanylate cyclase (GGDEF)-like protein
LFLWCASLFGAAGAVYASAPDLPGPSIINASGAWGIALSGRSMYWSDDHGVRTIEEVEAAGENLPWRVDEREEQIPLRGRALWIRFDASVPAGETWFLELGASNYERAQLFYRNRNGAWVTQEAGTGVAMADWSMPGRVPTFALSVDSPHPVRYWLRVEDDRSDFSAPLVLYRADTLQFKRERVQLLFGAFFGFAGLVALAAFANGLIYRDQAFFLFSMYIGLSLAGQLANAGVGAEHVWTPWPFWNAISIALWPGVATACGLWFVKNVIEPVRLSHILDLGVWALTAALLSAVAVDMTIGTPTSMRLVLLLTFLSLMAMLSMALWAWADGRDRSLRPVAIGFLPLLFLALFPLARAFGLMPSNLLTRYGLVYGTVMQLPLVYYGLHVRLMNRRESQLRAGALARSDALTGLPHRQALVERLDSSLAHARGHKDQCALLGVRVANLEAIVEEFGREAAEKALVVAASHLRRAIVHFDMAARVSPRDFMVLLEAPVTPEIAASRAQQIVASGLRQTESLPQALTLKFHVAIAMLPHPQLDGSGSLQWVLDGLDQIGPDARKAIRTLEP